MVTQSDVQKTKIKVASYCSIAHFIDSYTIFNANLNFPQKYLSLFGCSASSIRLDWSLNHVASDGTSYLTHKHKGFHDPIAKNINLIIFLPFN